MAMEPDMTEPRSPQIGIGIDSSVVAHGQLDAAAGHVFRVFGDDLDRTTRRVFAVEGALRAAQHLDVVNIKQPQQVAIDARIIDIVNIKPDAGIESLQRIGLADAANEDVDVGRRPAALDNVQVGHRALQAVNLAGLQIIEI